MTNTATRTRRIDIHDLRVLAPAAASSLEDVCLRAAPDLPLAEAFELETDDRGRFSAYWPGDHERPAVSMWLGPDTGGEWLDS